MTVIVKEACTESKKIDARFQRLIGLYHELLLSIALKSNDLYLRRFNTWALQNYSLSNGISRANETALEEKTEKEGEEQKS